MKDDAVALKVMLEEQRRLMRISNRKLAELEETISSQQENEVDLVSLLLRYGDHARTCKINQGGNYYMEPVECDCGWEREMIALKLIERFNEQADDDGGHATDCIISIWERCPSPGDNLRKAKCDCGLDDD